MTMTIGQLATKAGVKVATIRFYERQALIEEPPRRESGYREYPPEAVARVDFIRRAKDLGFSLKEVAELLELRMDPQTSCADLKARAENKISNVEERIRSLREIKKALTSLALDCKGTGPRSECPIIEALEGQSGGKS